MITTADSFIAIGKNNLFFSTMNNEQFDICTGNHFKRCDRLTQVKDTSEPSCMYALFQGDSKTISKLRKTVITENDETNFVVTSLYAQTCYYSFADE